MHEQSDRCWTNLVPEHLNLRGHGLHLFDIKESYIKTCRCHLFFKRFHLYMEEHEAMNLTFWKRMLCNHISRLFSRAWSSPRFMWFMSFSPWMYLHGCAPFSLENATICAFLVVQHDPSVHTSKLFDHNITTELYFLKKTTKLYSGMGFLWVLEKKTNTKIMKETSFKLIIKLQLLCWIHYMKDDMHHVLLLYHLCAIMKTFRFFSDFHVSRFTICKSTFMQDNQILDSTLRK